MKWAVLADIHSNREALECVDQYLRSQGISKIMILGDVIGYGADPNYCFDWAFQNASVMVRGNHEDAVLRPEVQNTMNDDAARAIDWTKTVLKSEHAQRIQRMPYFTKEDNVGFVHGSLEEPEKFRYILSESDARNSISRMEFPLCFFGHTHVPVVRIEKGGELSEFMGGPVRLNCQGHSLLNPGSVGQPRDGDSRLSFGLWDPLLMEFEIVRLLYDKEKSARKILDAGLPSALAERLL